VIPIERTDVEEAKLLLLTAKDLSARDALHIAVMLRHGITRIMSFDRGLDGVAESSASASDQRQHGRPI
jgi:hypothetical protein